jgi:hypothetical protein
MMVSKAEFGFETAKWSASGSSSGLGESESEDGVEVWLGTEITCCSLKEYRRAGDFLLAPRPETDIEKGP